MNYYSFHIGDYAAHTRNLTLLEDLAYRRLLDAYYLAERPFSGCSADVAREIGMRDQITEVEYVLSKFFEKNGDVWRNKRADAEISKYQEKLCQASRAGKASAERRSHPRSTPVDDRSNGRSTAVGQSGNGRATNQEPVTKNHTSPPESKAPRKRSEHVPAVHRPEDVAAQTWTDWLALRKAKRAPVTGTVLDGARKEADLAGMPLDAFLQVWCMRGSQGLQADWLKPAERQVASRVQPIQTFRERDAEAGMRRWEELTGQRHPDRARADGVVINVNTPPKLLEALQ